MNRRTARLAPFFALALFVALGGIVVRGANARTGETMPSVPPGFSIETIAHVSAPRELAVAPNGDLLVGTSGSAVVIVADATGTPRAPHVFATLPDRFAAGVALGPKALYVGTYGGVWRLPYAPGDRTASGAPEKLAAVRTGREMGHTTTSVAVGRETLYASVGSSCNVCEESDPTRATIQAMSLDGSNRRTRAAHIRNAIALTVDPATDSLWAGVAGQDELAPGHPYEIFDDIGAHAGTPDYGWPTCYENHRAVDGKRDCSRQTTSRVVFPAYETPIGAAFYAASSNEAHDFPETYRAGAFIALHGSWHTPLVEPRVVFVPMHGDTPLTPVEWNDPTAQWKTFVGGFQQHDGSRIGRPTGVAVGPDGSLFVGDDLADAIYRIRPKR